LKLHYNVSSPVYTKDPGMWGLQGLGLSVSEVVERVRGVLAGKVALAFLYGGRVKGYTSRRTMI
jgi:hypothetical protein